eukprot:COSAG03_NODE_4282_length_1609_cov_2.631126_2_plen_92_part_00
MLTLSVNPRHPMLKQHLTERDRDTESERDRQRESCLLYSMLQQHTSAQPMCPRSAAMNSACSERERETKTETERGRYRERQTERPTPCNHY